MTKRMRYIALSFFAFMLVAVGSLTVEAKTQLRCQGKPVTKIPDSEDGPTQALKDKGKDPNQLPFLYDADPDPRYYCKPLSPKRYRHHPPYGYYLLDGEGPNRDLTLKLFIAEHVEEGRLSRATLDKIDFSLIDEKLLEKPIVPQVDFTGSPKEMRVGGPKRQILYTVTNGNRDDVEIKVVQIAPAPAKAGEITIATIHSGLDVEPKASGTLKFEAHFKPRKIELQSHQLSIQASNTSGATNRYNTFDWRTALIALIIVIIIVFAALSPRIKNRTIWPLRR